MKLIDLTSCVLIAISFVLSIYCWSYIGVFDPIYAFLAAKSASLDQYKNYILIGSALMITYVVLRVIKGKTKPLLISGLVNKELSHWKKSKSFFTIRLLKIFVRVWVSVPILCTALYFSHLFKIRLPSELFIPMNGRLYNDYNQVLITAANVQGTLVGIVIPVIFALVEQLFRDQDSHFKAFLYWSRVIWLIMSSLGFLVFTLMHLSFSPERTYVTFYFSLSWFVLNVIGTAYLIAISIKFFFSSSRHLLIKKYTGQVLLLKETERNLASALRQRAEQ